MVRPQGAEDDVDVLQMLGPRRAVDEDIIEENEHKPPKVVAKHIVQQGLEGGRGIRKPERHHQKLEVAVVSAERRLGDVVGMHPHLMIPRA